MKAKITTIADARTISPTGAEVPNSGPVRTGAAVMNMSISINRSGKNILSISLPPFRPKPDFFFYSSAR
jgi:hypothetical protein